MSEILPEYHNTYEVNLQQVRINGVFRNSYDIKYGFWNKFVLCFNVHRLKYELIWIKVKTGLITQKGWTEI